jgi:hydroxyacylglutathione hydrolase
MPHKYVLDGQKLQCRVIPVTRARQNCSLIWCMETMRAALVDPGGDLDILRRAIVSEGLTLERVLITHSHVDHAGGAAELSMTMGVPIDGPHRADQSLIDQMESTGDRYGFEDCAPFRPDRWLEDGDEIHVGMQLIRALHCPGHTAGHIAYFNCAARIAFVGDILFRGAVGAFAAPKDLLTLLRSIRLKLFPLGDDVIFVPGHNALSTFGEERRTNPVVSDKAAERYNHLLPETFETKNGCQGL